MAIHITIPALIDSDTTAFDATIRSEGATAKKAKVTLSVKPKAPPSVVGNRQFVIDGNSADKQVQHEQTFPADLAITIAISDFGAIAEGDSVVLAVNGQASNACTVAKALGGFGSAYRLKRGT